MDFSSLYITRIQTSFDEDQKMILTTFREKHTHKDGSKVSLTNYFKGLPIVCPATILGVEHENLDLDINHQQAVAISADHYTLIRSKLFPLPIMAHAQYVNINKHMVSLNKLCFVEVLAEKRAAVRVELDPPARATMLFGDHAVVGQLRDISTQGIAIEADDFIPLENGTEMSVKFMLPDLVLMRQTLIKVPAILIGVGGSGPPYRYRMGITPEKYQEQLISRYSFHRQVDIIRGLKGMVG